MLEVNDNEKITYPCPVCGEEKNAIYAYIKPRSMCIDCLREEDPTYARRVGEAETEQRQWKARQTQLGKQRAT